MIDTFINSVILPYLGISWRDELYSGTLLAQIGEFSFLLVAVGLNSHTITQNAYQLTIAIIALSLLVSPTGGSSLGQTTVRIIKI
jgi:CPA2 family monovalent cation:H+ antiporter-2